MLTKKIHCQGLESDFEMHQHRTKRALFSLSLYTYTCSIVIDIKDRPLPFITVECTNIINLIDERGSSFVSPREQCSFETFELVKADGWLCLVCTTTAKFFISPDRNFVLFLVFFSPRDALICADLLPRDELQPRHDFPPFLFLFNGSTPSLLPSFRFLPRIFLILLRYLSLSRDDKLWDK